MDEHDRFQTANSLGAFIAGVGWVIIAIVVIGGLVAGSAGKAGVLVGFLVAVTGTVLGVLVVALGQLIQVMVGIERNTSYLVSQTVNTSAVASEVADKIKCPKCGTTYPRDSAGEFCENCGAALT